MPSESNMLILSDLEDSEFTAPMNLGLLRPKPHGRNGSELDE
jgi:hypothetical protein